MNVAAGSPTAAQNGGDCRQLQCNGNGAIESVADDADLPVDNNPCTDDICTAGVPSNPMLPAGTSCGMNLICDGAGQCVGCITANDCPGTDTECHQRTCNAGVCGVQNTSAGTPTSMQTAGDCLQNQCDGNGGVANVPLNRDVPVDGNQCTSDQCTSGVPSNPNSAPGTACNQNGGSICSGAGACVQCVVASTCPGQDTECQQRTCTANTCGMQNTSAGTPTSMQTAGDCLQNQCDGNGGVMTVVFDTDVPVDANQCTDNVCTIGVPSNPNSAAGTPCNQSGGSQCDGAGVCVLPASCNNSIQDGNETGVDCGGGSCPACADGLNCLVMSDCQSGVCTGNICQAPTCSDSVSNGNETGVDCGGPCPACVTVHVVRVGSGSAALSSASTPVYVEHRGQDGALLNTITLPIAASGANQPITLAGSATSEGGLSRSAHGAYVTLAGYAAAPNVATVASTASAMVNRVVARIDASGNVDTTTLLNTAFSGSNVRAATSSDGTGYWVTGHSSPSGTGGLWYIAHGTTGGTQVLATPNNARHTHIFAGQLYGSSGSSPFTNVFTVGTGLPTGTGETATWLAGLPTSNASPYSFVLLDRNAGVPGLDTLYLASDSAVVSGGGVQKWTFDGTTWTLTATFTNGATTFRGLAGTISGSNVLLFATATESSANRLVLFVDDGVTTPAGSVIATAGTNTAFRGVAISPN